MGVRRSTGAAVVAGVAAVGVGVVDRIAPTVDGTNGPSTATPEG